MPAASCPWYAQGYAWFRLGSPGLAWDRWGSRGIAWEPLGWLGMAWARLGPLGIDWGRLRLGPGMGSPGGSLEVAGLGSLGIAWCRLESLGIAWDRLGSPGIASDRLGAWGRLGSFHACILLSLVRPGFVTFLFWGCCGRQQAQNNFVTSTWPSWNRLLGGPWNRNKL